MHTSEGSSFRLAPAAPKFSFSCNENPACYPALNRTKNILKQSKYPCRSHPKPPLKPRSNSRKINASASATTRATPAQPSHTPANTAIPLTARSSAMMKQMSVAVTVARLRDATAGMRPSTQLTAKCKRPALVMTARSQFWNSRPQAARYLRRTRKSRRRADTSALIAWVWPQTIALSYRHDSMMRASGQPELGGTHARTSAIISDSDARARRYQRAISGSLDDSGTPSPCKHETVVARGASRWGPARLSRKHDATCAPAQSSTLC